MTKPKVLISDKMDPNAAAIFRERGCEVDEITGLTPDELKAIIGKYDGLAIRSSTKVTKDILDACTNLKVIGRAGIGVDNVDIPAASSKGVVVMNTPFGNSITTAEHAIALMFALARQLPEANAQTQAGLWPKNGFMGVEVTGKTLGLIGESGAGKSTIAALLLRAPPSRCNAEAVAAPWGTALPALWRDELIAGASHCDFESPTDWMCRLACGDTDLARQQQVRQGLLDAAVRWMR